MYRIGIDLGGTNVAYGLVDDEYNLVKKSSITTDRTLNADDLVDYIARGAFNFVKDNNIDFSDIKSIGIGSPGATDNVKGLLVYTVNLPFNKTPFRPTFAKYFNSIPVYVGNDANCAALGEAKAGGAKGYQDSITITLGTGVGGGIILGGKLYTGFNGIAAEIGHFTLNKNGIKCNCGRKGCFEVYASASAIKRETKKAFVKYPESLISKYCDNDINNINAKTAFDAMREGDKVGTKLVKNYIKDLADGIIDVINIFQPEIILLGGGVSKEGETLLKPIRRRVNKYAYGRSFTKRTKIERAVLGNDAGIIGAAILE